MGKISVTDNRQLKDQAYQSLSGKWGLVVGVNFFFAIMGNIWRIHEIGWLILVITAGPLGWGLAIFILKISRNQDAKFLDIFQGFNYFGKALWAEILTIVFIALWAVLLVIPGIIAMISYSMTFFILADDPSLSPLEAITKSKAMMQGNKKKYFCLILRFYGGLFICIITFGIALLWVIPYMDVTFAKFYEEIKDGNNMIREADSSF